jgi:hypothetical protein
MRPPRSPQRRLLAASALALAAVGLGPGVALAGDAGGSALTEEQWRLLRAGLLALGAVVAVSVVGGLLIDRTRRRRARSRAALQEAKHASEEDIAALGADLAALDTTMGVVDEAGDDALAELAAAREWFEKAHERLAQVSKPAELAPVSSALEAARFYMTSARSRVEGHGGLPRRAPCFFDTRHGPSVNDVGWIPADAAPRPVPACAQCMRQVNDNVQPPVRLIRASGDLIPFHNAPPHFESWFGGYFGGAAHGLVQGFPLGRALDDGFAGARNMGIGYGYVPASFADTGELDQGGGRTGFREDETSDALTGGELPPSDDGSPLRRGWRQGRARARAGGRTGRGQPESGQPESAPDEE